jgi:hypothetical protein
MSLISLPQEIWEFPAIGHALVELIDSATAKSADGFTAAEVCDLVVDATASFVTIARGYNDLAGEQKARIVDIAIIAYIRHIAPHVREAAKAMIATTLPWYLKWAPYVLSWIIKIDAVGYLISQVPAIRQAVYETLKAAWNSV